MYVYTYIELFPSTINNDLYVYIHACMHDLCQINPVVNVNDYVLQYVQNILPCVPLYILSRAHMKSFQPYKYGWHVNLFKREILQNHFI